MTADLNTTQLKKLRDLFIGMILNLTCNIEDTNTILRMIQDHNVLQMLLLILNDSRHDWPTHGAAQALMQYSHLSMQNGRVFELFE